MNRLGREAIFLMRLISDLTMTCVAWVIAYYLRFYTIMDAPSGIPDFFLYFKLVPFIIFIWLFTFTTNGFYRRSGHHHSPLTEGVDILQSCLFATMVFIAFSYFYEEYRYSRITMMLFVTINPLGIIAGRSLIRKYVRHHLKHAPLRKILVIGSADLLRRAFLLSQKPSFERQHMFGAILVPEENAADLEFCQQEHITVYQKPTDWSDFFVKNPTNSIFFAAPQRAYSKFENDLALITDQVPDIKIIPDILKYTRFSAGIEMIDGTPVIAIHESPLQGLSAITKRLSDIVGSLLGLIILSPLMIVISTMVVLSSKGPIFYRQPRMGIDGREFDCLKFRSMPLDAEKTTGAVWAKSGENRATWFGSILRRTSLDELPQLINVLKGEMSIVGPRPERPFFVNKFRSEIPGYMLRHKVRAGITGWAQVNGWRGNTSIEKRIEFDLYYIQNWTFWLDMKIILMTISEVIFSKNAY